MTTKIQQTASGPLLAMQAGGSEILAYEDDPQAYHSPAEWEAAAREMEIAARERVTRRGIGDALKRIATRAYGSAQPVRAKVKSAIPDAVHELDAAAIYAKWNSRSAVEDAARQAQALPEPEEGGE